MDFIHDGLSDGRRFRCLAIVDDFSRECPAIEVDMTGQLRRVVEPSPGRTVNYGYDPLGNLTTVDDAGLPGSWTYDLNGHLTAMNSADRGIWTYAPNSLGERVSQTNARGQTLQMTYDPLGRPLTRTEPEGTTTWTWGTQAVRHEIGQLRQVSGPDGYAEVYDYDSAGRLVQTTITADGGPYVLNRDYNAAGLPDSLTYPASTGTPLRVRYGYDHGLLNKVSDYDTPATVFWQLNTMDARGQPLDETLGSASPGIGVISSYSPLTGLLENRTASVGSATRQDLSFSWDDVGNLKTRTDHTQGGLTETFFYDALNRLSYSQRAGVQNLALGYNANGSIASRLEKNGESYSYQYLDAAHPHAVSAVLHDCGCNCLSDSYAYDANGNQTTRGGATDGRTISWSSYDLPVLITQDGVSSQFAYGPNRSRWKQVAVYSASTTETTLYLGGVMEKVTRGAVTEWKHYIPAGAGTMALQVRKSAGSPASATYYVTGDHLGSATAVMQADGTLLSQLSFAAFGSRRGSAWQDQPLAAEWTTITATTRRGFTGHEHLDNLSLVHMNGRVYDPQLGRFLSADPVYGGDLAQPQTLNPYSYASNNPLTYTDPSGWMEEIVVIAPPIFSDIWQNGSFMYVPYLGFIDGVGLDTVLEDPPIEDESKDKNAIDTVVVTANKQRVLPQTNPACSKYPRQAAFVNTNLPDATQIANQVNTTLGNILGLAGYESNWGGGQLITAGTNNYFSLKAGPAFATGATGTYQYGPNTFWTYSGPGMLASGNAFAQSYFGTRVNGITDPQAFAAALNAGGKYNSDPNYNSTLVSTINQANAVMGCP